MILILISFLVVTAASADNSLYSKVNDKTVCKYTEIKGSESGPDSCEYICDSPISGVKTKLLSCYDYEHLYFQVDGSWYSTWNAMTQIGGLSGLGNKNGLVEWVLNSKNKKDRDSLRGLIVRFDGVDPTSKRKSALSVFGLKKGEICWKGNFSSNESARKGLAAKCKESLNPETSAKH